MMRIVFIFLIVLLLGETSKAQEKRNLLANQYSRKFVSESITRDNSWIDYPAYQDREAWEKLPEPMRQKNIAEGEKYLGYDWPTITATMYLEFTRTGDRSAVDRPNYERSRALETLVVAELMEGEGRFLDDIVNGVFSYCEQTYWGSSAHFYLYGFEGSVAHPTTEMPDIEDPIIDLRVGDIAANLAWTWYFFHEEFDKISPIISRRLKDEIQSKVLDPYYDRYDFWWITGWGEGRVNNWNPWCNYNVLTCILLLEDDPEKKEVGVYKTMESVDLFINSYPEDGGCSEGPGYWAHAGGKLYDYLDLLKRNTSGNIDLFDHSLIKNMGRYIYRVYIGNGNNYINFADAPLKINHEAGRIFRFGEDIDDPTMTAFGAYLLKKSDHEESAEIGILGEVLENLFGMDELSSVTPQEPLVDEYYFPDLDLAVARDKEGTTDGFYFAAKGGSNGEHHNHNDVGSFMLYYNGTPVLIDVGVGTYTRETFSENRYNIWTMQSNYHNVPLINGTAQHQGGRYKAENSKFTPGNTKVTYTTDIANAYPEDAKVKAWTRTYTLDRGKEFIINDRYQLAENADSTKLHLMSGLPIEITKPGIITLSAQDFTLQLEYDPALLSASIENIKIDDPRLISSLGEEISRIVFTLKGNKLSGDLAIEVTERK